MTMYWEQAGREQADLRCAVFELLPSTMADLLPRIREEYGDVSVREVKRAVSWLVRHGDVHRDGEIISPLERTWGSER